jgi:hypothetical protein
MFVFVRLSVVGLLAVVSIGVWASPDLLDRCGLNITAMTESQEQETRLSQRREVLTTRAEVTQKRIQAKEAIIRDLLAERLTLLEAARQFKKLNETPVTFQDNYRAHFPGRSDGEKLCRQVLAWTESGLKQLTPSLAERLQYKFEEELAANMRRHGGIVVLPD